MATSILCPYVSNAKTHDVIIIGAGISGLAAAEKLHQKNYNILILEARDRIGGRIWSVKPWGSNLDLGASWIHGIDNNPLSKLIEQGTIKTLATSYNSEDLERKLNDMVLYNDKGKKIPQSEINASIPLLLNFSEFISNLTNKNISLNDAFELYTQKEHITGERFKILKYQVISSYVYEFANDLENLAIDLEKPYANSKVSGEQVIFPEGYIQLANLLAQKIPIKLNQVVTKINYTTPLIEIETQNHKYYARAVIITLPVSVLNAKKISFNPSLPVEKTTALSQIKMGSYDKIFLYFNQIFWDKDSEWIGLIQSDPAKYPVLDIMNYYKISKHPILLVFNAGKQAEQFEQLSDQHIINNIMQELRIMYGKDIPPPTAYVITRWHNDPYSLGSYSYLAPGVSVNNYKLLGKPVNNRLFFAGEATSLTDPATVHGAYSSGIRAAKEVELILPLVGD